MIGPHNGKELELMLAGKKRFARFSAEAGLSPEEAGDAGFEPHVAAGRIKKFVHASQTGPAVETRYYCLPGEEWRVKLDLLVSRDQHTERMKDFAWEDLVRMDGWLLGYEAEDIEDFVRRNKSHR